MLLLNRPFETRYFLWHVPEINLYFSYIPTAFLKSKEYVLDVYDENDHICSSEIVHLYDCIRIYMKMAVSQNCINVQ